MHFIIIIFVSFFFFLSSLAANERPERVASLNLCTDQLVHRSTDVAPFELKLAAKGFEAFQVLIDGSNTNGTSTRERDLRFPTPCECDRETWCMGPSF